MKVHDGDDRDRLVLYDEEDAERKSAQQRASDIGRDQRKLQRPALDAIEHAPQPTQKGGAKPSTFALVPCRSLERVHLRLGRTRSSIIGSSADARVRPGPPSTVAPHLARRGEPRAAPPESD